MKASEQTGRALRGEQLTLIFLFGLSLLPKGYAQGLPLDVAGIWEAVPNLVSAGSGARAYPRMELRLTGTTHSTDDSRNHYFNFEYAGTWTIHQFADLILPANSFERNGGNCRGEIEGYERRIDPYTYAVRLTNTWVARPTSPALQLTSSFGSAVLSSVPPRWHNTYDRERVFGVRGQLSANGPVANPQGARLWPTWASVVPVGQNACFTGLPYDAGQPTYWRIGGGSSGTNFTGILRGRVMSAVPVLTEGGEELHRATIRVSRLEEHPLARGLFESDADYAAYLRGISAPGGTIVALKPEDRGRFRVENLPLLGRVGRTNSQITLLQYLVEISNGEVDERALDPDGRTIPGRTNTLSFRPLRAAGIVPQDQEQTFLLTPVSDAQAKRQIADDLIRLAPDNYRAPENQALARLATFESRPMTEAEDEALRRALWAERVARDAALYANDLLLASLTALGNLLADTYSEFDIFNRQRIRAGREALKRMEEGPLAPKVVAELGLGPNGGTPAEFRRLLSESRESEIAEKIAKALKAVNPALRRALETGGMSGEHAKAVAVSFEQVLLLFLNAVQTQTAQGATKDAIKLILKTQTPKSIDLLYDSSLPVSYSALTAPSLQFTAEKLNSWSRSDPEAYLRDRARVAGLLGDFSERMAANFAALAYLEFGAEAADTSARVFGAAGLAFKWAAVVEKVAKISKFLANKHAFVDPMLLAFRDAPKTVNEGVRLAFGETPSPSRGNPADADSLIALGVPLPVSPPLVAPDTTALSAAIQGVIGRLKSNQVGQASAIMAGDQPGGYLHARNTWRQEVELLSMRLQSQQYTGEAAMQGSENRLIALEESLEAMRGIFEEAFLSFMGDILQGGFSGADDPRYVLARNRLVEQFDPYLQAQSNFIFQARALADRATSLEVPALPVVSLELDPPVSRTTGLREITAGPEEFRLTGRVRNRSRLSVSGLSVQLSILGASNVLTIVSATNRIVAGGNLAADDGVAGSGADEAEVEWRLRFNGSLGPQSFWLQVNPLEYGEAPVSFVSRGRTTSLGVDVGSFDADFDGMPDAFERLHQLSVNAKDGALDPDGDGLENLGEFEAGTDPRQRDTDGDGLADGEEIVPGADGAVTHPLSADTDGDGATDALDAEPLNPTVSRPPNTPRPGAVLEVTPDSVLLTPQQPIVTVHVGSAGSGNFWSAISDDPTLVEVSPAFPDGREDGPLTLRLATSGNLASLANVRTFVRIVSLSGAASERAIQVVISGRFGSAPVIRSSPGGMLLEWNSVFGAFYQVQYSDDLSLWKSSPTGRLRGGGLLRWTDSGPPATEQPAVPGPRFYRVTVEP